MKEKIGGRRDDDDRKDETELKAMICFYVCFYFELQICNERNHATNSLLPMIMKPSQIKMYIRLINSVMPQ